ncbi:atrial natriuretic peptide receptor 2-like [Lineus longissimus]|uniref:atrial natriuretic peptide receptor 2-like n=1 Tax=Lineus longissimus TaxID=88925 RepID=UPI00315DC265
MFVVLGVVYLLYRRFQWQKLVNEMKWKLDFGDIMQERKSRSMMRFRSNGCMSVASLGTSVSNNSVREQEYITTGQYNGVIVAMKHIKHLNEIKLTRELKIELSQLHDVVHTNILRFIGACIEPGKVHIVSEYCSKGSLQDVLENENVDLDWSFRHSLINDILKGLQYLHMSKFKCHGNLKSSNCLVDNRFSVKLGDFAPVEWQRESARTGNDLLWTAPEVLRRHCQVNQQSDIYSLAIILQEIIERKGPFYMHHDVIHTANTEAGYAADEIVQKVMDSRTHPVRPTITPGECSVKLSQLVIKCWAENPEARPKLQDVLTEFSGIHGARGKLNIMDSLMQRMEQYANNLEDLVEERTGKYLEEKKRVEELLHRLLPPVIATQIQEKGQVDPETFECVTIYFSDIVGFTKLSSMSTPVQVIDFLNDLYTMFDEIISEYDVYKVETIGDAYMVVSGLPNKNGDNHAAEISKMSLKLLKSIKKFTISHCPDQLLQLRIGLHSGPCAAGVVGLTMPRYCLFGDTVNTASRMESNGEPLKIHISNSTNEILSRYGYFTTTFRGELAIKGKGQMKTYWLDSVTDASRQ